MTTAADCLGVPIKKGMYVVAESPYSRQKEVTAYRVHEITEQGQITLKSGGSGSSVLSVKGENVLALENLDLITPNPNLETVMDSLGAPLFEGQYIYWVSRNRRTVSISIIEGFEVENGRAYIVVTRLDKKTLVNRIDAYLMLTPPETEGLPLPWVFETHPEWYSFGTTPDVTEWAFS